MDRLHSVHWWNGWMVNAQLYLTVDEPHRQTIERGSRASVESVVPLVYSWHLNITSPLLRGIFSVVKTAVPHGPWLVVSTEVQPRMRGESWVQRPSCMQCPGPLCSRVSSTAPPVRERTLLHSGSSPRPHHLAPWEKDTPFLARWPWAKAHSLLGRVRPNVSSLLSPRPRFFVHHKFTVSISWSCLCLGVTDQKNENVHLGEFKFPSRLDFFFNSKSLMQVSINEIERRKPGPQLDLKCMLTQKWHYEDRDNQIKSSF